MLQKHKDGRDVECYAENPLINCSFFLRFTIHKKKCIFALF